MKPEALDAIVTQTMRPNALEAATAQDPVEKKKKLKDEITEKSTQAPVARPNTPTTPSTPFGQRTHGTQSAAKVVEEVVHGVKVAVDAAIAWAERKVDDLSSEADSTGPYTSPATCVPSDLDAIASGVLPAMPTQDPNGKNSEKAKVDEEAKADHQAKKETKGKEEESRKDDS
ncbi:hypothetical protein EK21DRAFT_91663 [Setomelanomma holmii]|uniref:Uncharacterized protein n=1 Tax=Setomelanomma holmii TaxID=210430 RepID=A0A9P4H5U6_9PLEO|nr:hypothetical protein EK21DRAFT_91663 [Setomelanomma holmii]